MTDAAIKYFTVEEANATLPYVRSIVEDIVQDYEQWRNRVHRYEVIMTSAGDPGDESEEQIRLRSEADEIARRISRFINELASVGCVFKGFQGGLVDFYSRRDERDIFLCWKLGEDEVAHWHEIDTGYAGRQPLAPEPVSEEAH
jgi:hypothetical protein